MNQKKKKKGGAGAWAVIAAVIIIVNMINSVDEWEIRRFFMQLRHNPTLAIAILAIVISVVIALIALAANKKRMAADQPVRRSSTAARSGGTAAQHSHDRIQGYTAGSEDAYLHWKKQLDGFLAAGIIDRKEYIALLERRRDSF